LAEKCKEKRNKKPSATSSPGYTKKQVFALEAKPVLSLREELKADETKVQKRQKTTPLAAKKLMRKIVHLTVRPNITWLLVLNSKT